MRSTAERIRQAISRAPAASVESSPAPVHGGPARPDMPPSLRRRGPARARRKWLLGLGLLGVLLLVVVWRWQAQRPQEVTLVHPTRTTITETIASSGRVRGVTETVVGAQTTGIVAELFVAEGDRVSAGQPLAVLERDVAKARLAQAEQALSTARAQLAQVESGPRPSEVQAAAEQVRQAQAQWQQQRAAVQQAQQAVAQARAQWQQFQAELELATMQLKRSRSLLERGYISPSEYDQVETQFQVAEKRLEAAQQTVESAQAEVRAAQAGVQAMQANMRALEARLQTVEAGATPEEIEVARQRVAEAQQALRVAQQQVEEAVVTAPFAGLVTAINAEPGQPVGTQGVVRLVSDELEIRVDVDEINLADLAVGQEAIMSSTAFPGDTFRGRVAEIGAAVDQARGTVMVRIRPQQPPDWLRPGQTVNVNIITHPAVARLLVPAPAVRRSGEQTVVFVVEDGRALEQVVLTRPPTPQGVPVLAGLQAEDRIIANAAGITAGEPVRVRESIDEESL